jgi:hypothetical protein
MLGKGFFQKSSTKPYIIVWAIQRINIHLKMDLFQSSMASLILPISSFVARIAAWYPFDAYLFRNSSIKPNVVNACPTQKTNIHFIISALMFPISRARSSFVASIDPPRFLFFKK